MKAKHKKNEGNYDAIITIRTTKEKKKEHQEKAAKCRMLASEYGRRVLDGEHPKAALNEEETNLYRDEETIYFHWT